MPYIFGGLVILNVMMFGFYSFIHKPTTSDAFVQAQSQVKNPVTFTNVSSEIPPMIGTKK